MSDYTLRRNGKARRLSLRLESDGELVVIAPKFVPKLLISHFVDQQEPWITTQRSLQAARKRPVSETTTSLFGKEYQLDLRFGAPAGKIRLLRDSMVIESPTANWQPVLTRFLKLRAEQYLTERMVQLAKHMAVHYTKLVLRQQKTRWGSCSTSGTISLNWRLVHYKPEIIDYVIIHELAHTVHHNHSAQFWNLVAKYDPEHQLHRGWLRRNGLSLG